MQRLTARETERLNDLLEKKKAQDEHDAEFIREVKKRKVEVLNLLNVSDNTLSILKEISTKFYDDADTKELIDILLDPKIIKWWHDRHSATQQ